MKKFIVSIIMSLMLISCNEEPELKPKQEKIIGGIARESPITVNEILKMEGVKQYLFYNDLIFEKILNLQELGFKKDEFETNKEYNEKLQLLKKKINKKTQDRINSYVIEERRINMFYNAEKQRWESEIGENYIYDLSILTPSNSSYKNANFDSGTFYEGFIHHSYLKFHTNGKKIFFDEVREKARARGNINVRVRLICSSKGIKNIITREQTREQNYDGKYYTDYRYIVNTNVIAYVLIDDKTGEVIKEEIF